MKVSNHCIRLIFAVFTSISYFSLASAQTHSGAAFLKIPVGARQQGMSGSMTAGLDDLHILYTNPGASGFFREWQWSVGYTEWLGDIYNASLTYGRQLRLGTPWSRKVNFAVGFNYQGIREFDSSRGAQPATSANDLLLSFVLGTPISVISDNLGAGVSAKFFRSELATFEASSVLFDFGLQYRTPRFGLANQLFRYAYLSTGLAVTQVGKSLTFISAATPLPSTVRAGLALNMGTHDGMQLQLSADYQDVRDEKGRVAFGIELTNLLTSFNSDLGRMLDVRGGYGFDKNLLNKFSFGVSFKIDDYMQGPLRKLVPRNSAARLDASVMNNNEFFSSVYRGSLTHFSNRPEKFDFEGPDNATFAYGDTVRLAWQVSDDPDLYDDVDYLLVFVREDEQMLSEMVNSIEKNQVNIFELFDSQNLEKRDDRIKVTSLFLTSTLDNLTSLDAFLQDFYEVSTAEYNDRNAFVRHGISEHLQPGEYHWAMLAYDHNQHLRFAERDNDRIKSFLVEIPDFARPDLTISITDESVVGDLPPLLPEPAPVYYTPGNASLTPETAKALNFWIDFIEKHPLVEFEISGHADKTGPGPVEFRRRFNQELSEDRARNVARYLIENGVNTFRLRAKGYGEDLPIVDENSAHAYRRNRRVEISLFEDFRMPDCQHFADVTIANRGQTAARDVAVAIYDLTEEEHQKLKSEFDAGELEALQKPKNGTNGGSPRLLRDSVLPEIMPGDSVTIRVECDPERPYVVAMIDGSNVVDELNELNNWHMARFILPAADAPFPESDKGSVKFAFDSHGLTPKTEQTLSSLSGFLERHPNVKIAVEGHADNRGSEAYNLGLSRQRAESVGAFLLEKGVAARRVRTEGLGETRPLVDEDNEAAWAKNRRVEIILFNE